MGAKNSACKVLVPPKKKSVYAMLFPRDKEFTVYEKATKEFESITGSKRKNMTKDQFFASQKERFAGMDASLLENIWNAFDSDNNGVMDVDEYRLYVAINSVGSRRQRAIALFGVTDTSNDHALQKEEIQSLMVLVRKFNKKAGMDAPPEETISLSKEELAEVEKQVDAFMKAHDKDGNGNVEFEEFLDGWQDQAFADFNFFDDKSAPLTGTGAKPKEGEKPAQEPAAEEKKEEEPKAEPEPEPEPAAEGEKEKEKKEHHHHHHHKKEKKEGKEDQ